MIYRAAKALFEDWKSTDREIALDWETAPSTLRRTFIRHATVALEGAGIIVQYGVSPDGDNDVVIPVKDKKLGDKLVRTSDEAELKFRYVTGWISAKGEIIVDEDKSE